MKTIKAYHPLIMAAHKFILTQVIILVMTGLPFFSKSFDFLAYTIGTPLSILLKDTTPLAAGLMIFRTVHWISGFLLISAAIIFVLGILKDIKELSIWPDRWGMDAIFDGIKQMKLHYLENKPAKFGKFNMGQKAAAWVIYFLVLLLMLTGVGLIYSSVEIGVYTKDTTEFLRSIHSLSFVLLSLVLIVHVIFALLPSNLPSLKAMFHTGEVDIDYVKKHHFYWYEKLKKKNMVKDDE